MWGKAVTFLRRAGTAAADRSAYREAAASFERALAALEHWPPGRATTEQAIDLRLDLARAYSLLGRQGERLAIVEEAERLAVEIGDPARLGWAHLGMAGVLGLLLDFDRAIAYGERALAAAKVLEDPRPAGQRELHAGPHPPRSWPQRPGDRPFPDRRDPHRRGRLRQPWDAWPLRAPPPRRARLAGDGAGGGRSLSGGRGSRRGGPPAHRGHPAARRPPRPALPRAGPLPSGRRGGGAAPLRAGAGARPDHGQRGLAAGRLRGARPDAGSVGTGRRGHRSCSSESIAMELAGSRVARANRIRQLGEAYLAAGRVEEALARGREALELARRRGQRDGEAGALALLGARSWRASPRTSRAPRSITSRPWPVRPGWASVLSRRVATSGSAGCTGGEASRARRGTTSTRPSAALKEMGMTLWAEQAEREREALVGG